MTVIYLLLAAGCLVATVLLVFEREESARLRAERDAARAETDRLLDRQPKVLPIHHISRRLTAADIATELVRVEREAS